MSLYKSSKDKDYVGELFTRYTGFVVSICRNYLHNLEDCEDASMQIFEKLFNDLLRFEVANFKSWLHVITKNHCMMMLRKPQREIFTDQFVEKDDAFHLHEAKEKEEMLQQLESAIQELTEEQKKCVQLFFIEEKSYKEIESLTGYDYKQVKSYIQNGKRNLQHKLNKIIFTAIALLVLFLLHD